MKKNCAHCGKEFEAERNNTKYCKRGCSTMACNKRKGFKIGRIRAEEKGKDLAVKNPSQVVLQGMHGIEMGRTKEEITMAGAVESFIGASASHIVAHQLTKGEYKIDFAKIAADQKFTLYLLQNLYKALKIPFPPGPTLTNKPNMPGSKNGGLMM